MINTSHLRNYLRYLSEHGCQPWPSDCNISLDLLTVQTNARHCDFDTLAPLGPVPCPISPINYIKSHTSSNESLAEGLRPGTLIHYLLRGSNVCHHTSFLAIKPFGDSRSRLHVEVYKITVFYGFIDAAAKLWVVGGYVRFWRSWKQAWAILLSFTTTEALGSVARRKYEDVYLVKHML